VRERSTTVRLLAVLMALVFVAAACGGDDNNDKASDSGSGGQTEGQAGGELTDLGTFVDGPPEHIDPALNTLLDNYQVINALYDGLTEFDFTDPENPELKPQVAESYESNADATEWTFKIRDGEKFSNGEPVLPSSFQRAWERATDPDFAGDYSYLFNFIDGGAEKLDGSAPTLSGVTVDDDAMTLKVKMDQPYANFAAVAGFQTFYPMPKAVDDLDDQKDWENGLMIGNGPYKLSEPRNDQQIVVERNDQWAGDIFGNTKPKLDKITFVISQDVESAYNAFEAGDGDTASLVPGRVKEADENYATTLNVPYLGSYYYAINMKDPVVGGPDNKLLRQALSQAIDRDAINDAVYDGTRTNATGVTPEGIPGYQEGLCKYCAYDKDAAQDAFNKWKDQGGKLDKPIKVQLNPGAGHEDVVQIIIDNWREIGIDAVADPLDPETYFSQLGEGACQVCRDGWIADYPTYDNFTYDLFATDSIGGNNHGQYSDPEFDRLVAEAKANTDADEAADQYRQAEKILLNDDIGVIPINYYKGDYVYNPDKVENFHQTPGGIVLYEQVTVKD
jgi:ABC-type oligopeptide transport system substrate-binding subunit